jgi:hypothetical protein
MAVAFTSCSKVLDKNDLSAISEPYVWSDPSLATAFVNNIYLTLPGWNVTLADASDEASRSNIWNNGTLSIDEGGAAAYWPYANIRTMNIFMSEVDGPQSTLSEDLRKTLRGQVRFIRAYTYFEMVKRYGGVPLITDAQQITDDLLVERTSTKDCFDFILRELETAAEELPKNYSAADLGRITRGAALGFRARVLLFRASPQFNPSNNATHWQNAYDAGKAALAYLDEEGYGLMDHYSNADLFLNEMNKEVILAIRYLQPGRTQNRDASVRPIDFTANATGGCHPIQKLVDAFPLKSGKRHVGMTRHTVEMRL